MNSVRDGSGSPEVKLSQDFGALFDTLSSLPSAYRPGYFPKEGYNDAVIDGKTKIVGAMVEIAMKEINPGFTNVQEVNAALLEALMKSSSLRQLSNEKDVLASVMPVYVRVISGMMTQIGVPAEEIKDAVLVDKLVEDVATVVNRQIGCMRC